MAAHSSFTPTPTGLMQETVTLQFDGEGLDKKDVIGKSDPYLIFYRTNEDHT